MSDGVGWRAVTSESDIDLVLRGDGGVKGSVLVPGASQRVQIMMLQWNLREAKSTA
ncbi:MAG: hypothetical protein AB9869_27825 [Verrucomicrobiia bacterium]